MLFLLAILFCLSAYSAPAADTEIVRAKSVQGIVEVLSSGTTNWVTLRAGDALHGRDRLRTGADSRLVLQWSDQSVITFGARTELQILPPAQTDDQNGLELSHGVFSFFHRDRPGKIQIITRGAMAGVEGTEFVMSADGSAQTELAVIDGKVKFSSAATELVLTNGQSAVADPGQPPKRTAGFIANNVLQWCFYYPAVLNPDDLDLSAESRTALKESLAAYQTGDLLVALQKLPANRTPADDNEKLFDAALLLSVGEVDSFEKTLSQLSNTNASSKVQRLADALRQLVAAVKHQPFEPSCAPQNATEWLADSYYQQSQAVPEKSLIAALASARSAVAKATNFGFAWERVAELEFCFGRVNPAMTALDRSLELSPRNPQALALKGFLLSAENRPREAVTWFARSLEVDSALGNAWLGRGLCKIRLHDMTGGKADLLVAAASEPQRAELRSYLGKAYVASGDDARATKELDLAKKLDPKDPTAWLYSALQKQQGNQINDAIRDLEKSEQLNNNRSVYRSQLLLDQDQAVRAADLAGIYQDAGMTDVARHEAGRAVSDDYANYSAHLFLASSYDQLRDPNWSNLRYETPAESEFTIANLLAPGSAGVLTPLTAQQPYTKLFDQNRVGVSSDTTYLSRGTWMERGAQFGTYDDFSYSFSANYISDNGQRANNDNERRSLTLTVKDQFTSQDTAFFTVQQLKASSGDVNEYYNQANAFGNPNGDYRFNETQQPNLSFGYHHEWGPGSHTLFYATRQVAYESAYASNAVQYVANTSGGSYIAEGSLNVAERPKINPELNSAELQQILESPDHTTIVGGRYQWGDVHYQNHEWTSQAMDVNLTGFFVFPLTWPEVINQDFTLDFNQYSGYAYHTWQIADPLSVTAGLDYDWLSKPVNAGTTPFTDQTQTVAQWSPKAGFIFQPLDKTTLRGAYTRSLSGFANGQSTRIEPTEVAGFNQFYRGLAPESVIGDSSGSKFDTFDLSLEQKFDTGTYLSVQGELLYAKLQNTLGGFVYYADQSFTNDQPTYPQGLNQTMNFHEQSLVFTADQLLGKQWSAGAVYRVSRAKYDQNFGAINNPNLSYTESPFQASTSETSILNTLNLHANWNHPCGLFSILSADWVKQDNYGFSPAEPGDDFWQFNAYAGYRMFHRRVEFTVGLLNIFDQNYKLEPLNLYNETARSRTFLARLRINF